MYEHLQPFLKNTPLSNKELLIAWDGLSDESIIYILYHLFKKNSLGEFQQKIPEDIIIKAIAHENPYIRYLAVDLSRVGWWGKNETYEIIYNRIKNDSHKLVKAPLCTRALLNGLSFISLEHSTRLKLLSEGRINLYTFSEALEEVIKQQNTQTPIVTEKELMELVSEFVESPAVERYSNYENKFDFDDGFSEYLHNTAPNSTWKLLPKLPVDAAYTLLRKIPIPKITTINTEIINEDYINSLHVGLLDALLMKKDFRNMEIRKKIVIDEKYSNETRSLATTWLSFSDEEFGRFVKNYSKCVAFLYYSKCLTLVQNRFVCKYLDQDESYYSDNYNLTENYELRIKDLQLHLLKEEKRDLNILEIAQRLIKNTEEAEKVVKYSKYERFQHILMPMLSDIVDHHNLWDSYVTLKQAYSKEEFYTVQIMPTFIGSGANFNVNTLPWRGEINVAIIQFKTNRFVIIDRSNPDNICIYTVGKAGKLNIPNAQYLGNLPAYVDEGLIACCKIDTSLTENAKKALTVFVYHTKKILKGFLSNTIWYSDHNIDERIKELEIESKGGDIFKEQIIFNKYLDNKVNFLYKRGKAFFEKLEDDLFEKNLYVSFFCIFVIVSLCAIASKISAIDKWDFLWIVGLIIVGIILPLKERFKDKERKKQMKKLLIEGGHDKESQLFGVFEE